MLNVNLYVVWTLTFAFKLFFFVSEAIIAIILNMHIYLGHALCLAAHSPCWYLIWRDTFFYMYLYFKITDILESWIYIMRYGFWILCYHWIHVQSGWRSCNLKEHLIKKKVLVISRDIDNNCLKDDSPLERYGLDFDMYLITR